MNQAILLMNGNNFQLCTHSNTKNLNFFIQLLSKDQMNQAILLMNGNSVQLCTHSNTKNFILREKLLFFSRFVLIFQFFVYSLSLYTKYSGNLFGKSNFYLTQVFQKLGTQKVNEEFLASIVMYLHCYFLKTR